MTTVEQIHREFYTASEKIVNFVVPEKAKILHQLGFTASEDAKDFDPAREALRDLVLGYQYHYPNNKFITDDEVHRICKKYNLICGPVSAYTGKVPDSKVKDIASFNLHYSHARETEYEYKVTYHQKGDGWTPKWLTASSPWQKKLPKIISGRYFYSTFDIDSYLNSIYNTGINWLVDKMKESTKEFKGLYICAPEKEMKTDGLTKKGLFAFLETKRHIEDPVVLHPCKGGWLILAAWGPEASDQNVVNHKMN